MSVWSRQAQNIGVVRFICLRDVTARNDVLHCVRIILPNPLFVMGNYADGCTVLSHEPLGTPSDQLTGQTLHCTVLSHEPLGTSSDPLADTALPSLLDHSAPLTLHCPFSWTTQHLLHCTALSPGSLSTSYTALPSLLDNSAPLTLYCPLSSSTRHIFRQTWQTHRQTDRQCFKVLLSKPPGPFPQLRDLYSVEREENCDRAEWCGGNMLDLLLVRISTILPHIMPDNFRDFLQYLQEFD
jgi:hypothetical protein